MLAINQKTRRLPGFRFEAFAPAREDVLPRMDVALFVGFASTGPIGIPVAVEAAEQFKAIFGNDLPLVWDAEKNDLVYAHLAPTVRAFFRNGGKRCWILRVARLESSSENPLNRARYNFFPLAGLAGISFDNRQIYDIIPAFARARSKGSWSDDLQIGTATLSAAAKFKELDKENGRQIVTLEVPVNKPVKNGELLRLKFSAEGLVLLMTADVIEDGAKKESPTFAQPAGKLVQKIVSNRYVWLENLPAISSPVAAENVWVRIWTDRNNPEPAEFLPVRQAKLELQAEKNEGIEVKPPKIILNFTDLAAGELPPAGSLLMTKFQHKLLCLQVETVNINNSGGPGSVEVGGRGLFCSEIVPPPNSSPTVERLTFELWLKQDEQSFIKLSDLAYNADHERFWGNLPTDDRVFRLSEEKSAEFPEIFDWTQTNEAANFSIAGNGRRETFYFPLFAAAIPKDYLGAVPQPGTKLQRDGLEVFDEDLFLDRKLKNTGSGNLLNEAEFIRYLSPRPRPLWGIHSALLPEIVSKLAIESLPTKPSYTSYSLDECTIIAVPDAIHRGWAKNGGKEKVVSPPVRPKPVFSPPERPDWWHFQDCWNPTIKKVSEPPAGQFLDCGIRPVEAPHDLKLLDEDVSSGKFTLVWESTETGEELKFVLEESTSPKFEFPQELMRDPARHFDVPKRGAGVYFYRVRAEIGRNFSDWSVGLPVIIPEAEDMAVNVKYESDVLLAVQRALLRMCATRGDLFAVLNLPEHFDESEAFAHVGTLKTTRGLTAATAGVEPFSADETKVLSFGAMYHPWLLTHEEDFEGFRNIPPDGAICGTFARRADERGAWIAPANEGLQGVLGLAKEIRRERFLDFQDNLINLVRQEPRGFLVLDSDTLCDDADLRSINVRRLLSLLRRLAVKHGAEYVFEPNDERFRRQVERGFAALLDLMFVRGAFAGTTPANSYQVVVGETVNNFRSVEQGRFIVELRVAPSLPLKFVTVRLVQAGGRSNVVEVF